MNLAPAARIQQDAAHCLRAAARSVAPRRALSVSEWADQHRILSGKQAAERGRWRTSRTPFLREIMDCLSATSRVTDIVVMKSSQVGVTEAMINAIGYGMDHSPGPTMVLMPTLESRDAWRRQKLAPLLTDTEVIRDLIGGVRSRDAANSADAVDFPGGILYLAGGNSPNSYAQKSVARLYMDDLDRFPPTIGEEGDPVALAFGRTKAFARVKRMLVSTPTVHDLSLIEREWLASDQRRYHVDCPHCGTAQPLEWGGTDKAYGIRWNETLTEAWYVCRDCAAEIAEHHKPALLAGGRWIPAHPERRVRGYHLTALLAPVGLGPSWLDLARQWRTAHKGVDTLRTFINTQLGEPWVDQGDQVEPTGLLARLEDFPEGLRPLAVTAGVDVQKDRLEVSIIGWDLGEEAWHLEHSLLPGDTARPEVWADLGELLVEHKVDAAAVDSGYNTSMVYAFVQARPWAFAIKGTPGPGRPIVEDPRLRHQRLRRQKKRGPAVHLVGVDQAKALLYSRLQLPQPGPGYMHFPRRAEYDDEFFAQLTAEKLVTKIRGTRPYAEWVQTRPRNEALDCANYALAALRLANIDLAGRQRQRAVAADPNARAPATGGLRRIGRIGGARPF